MKQLFFSFLFILISCATYAENNCNCPNSSQKIKQIQDDIDKKQFELIPERIDRLPIKDLSCKQYAQLCYLQYYISKENLVAADSISNLLEESFTSNLCDDIQALYKYQIGTLLIKKNIPDSALTYLLKAKELAIKTKNDVLHAKSLSRMAYLFESLLDQPEKSLEYNRQAIHLIQNKDENNLLLLLMGNRSAYFGRIYDLKNDKLYIDSLYLNALQTLELAKKLKIIRSISNCYSMISGAFFTKKELSKAIQYCDSGISILNINVDFRILKALYTKKTDYYIELKDYKKARQFADSMLKYAQLENNILNIASTYERLYELERNAGNYEKALIYYEKHTKINDSIKSIEKTEITTELEQKYNKSENEKRINELNRKNEVEALRVKFLIAGVVAALLAIAIIIFFYRQTILKSKFKALEVEQRLNRARMNPHFIFNALSSIQSLSLEPENQSKVSGYISRFSKIMRQSLESTYNDLVSIEEEISFLENYLNIQKMRFPNKFDYQIEMADDLEIDEIKVPSMLLQPFIENSIEHGFKGIEYEGIILIKIFKENSQLKIIISDNGKGFGDSKLEKKYPSRAVQIITDRLAIINKNYKSTANFKIVDNIQTGVKVEVCLPIIFNG
jgi:tetratricopeptide (TPR) repeat protein